jgi:hypothetical protein
METRLVSIKNITVKDEVQQRVSLNEQCTTEYADEIRNGVKFPPMVVFDDGETLILSDGRHRYEAYLLAGVDTVEVIIIKGSQRDAILHATGANGLHGLRMTNLDKRKAVSTLLTDQEWRNWSDEKIAKHCFVSSAFVGKLRKTLTLNGLESDPVRIGADGRTINTENIGTKPKTDDVGGVKGPETVEAKETSTETSGNAENPKEGASELQENEGSKGEEKDLEVDTEGQVDSDQKSQTSEEIHDENPTLPSEKEEEPSSETKAEEKTDAPDADGSSSGTENGKGGEKSEEKDESSKKEEESQSQAEAKKKAEDQKPDTGSATGSTKSEMKEKTVDPLRVKIAELEAVIREKDARIKELVAENEYLKREIIDYQKHENHSMKTVPSIQEGTQLEQSVS